MKNVKESWKVCYKQLKEKGYMPFWKTVSGLRKIYLRLVWQKNGVQVTEGKSATHHLAQNHIIQV